MKIKYEFVTGEVIEIEVTEEMGNLIVELDRLEYNNNHKETRRHCTLSTLGYEGKWLVDPDSDFTLEERKYPLGLDEEKWQYALRIFTDKQRDAFVAVYKDGLKAREYAEMMGMTEANVSVHLYRARKKIKKVFGSV